LNIFKKARKMNRSEKEKKTDRKIMIALLTPKNSMYKLEQTSRINYATVYRHVKKLQKIGLITTFQGRPRKNGKPDKRGAEKLELTPKGLATLLIDGDLQEEELIKVNEKIFQQDLENILPKKSLFMIKPVFAEVFSKSLLEIRPKINLKFFDEKWFNHIYYKTLDSNIARAIRKYHVEFEKEGVWLSKAEADREAQEFRELLDKFRKKNFESKLSGGGV